MAVRRLPSQGSRKRLCDRRLHGHRRATRSSPWLPARARSGRAPSLRSALCRCLCGRGPHRYRRLPPRRRRCRVDPALDRRGDSASIRGICRRPITHARHFALGRWVYVRRVAAGAAADRHADATSSYPTPPPAQLGVWRKLPQALSLLTRGRRYRRVASWCWASAELAACSNRSSNSSRSFLGRGLRERRRVAANRHRERVGLRRSSYPSVWVVQGRRGPGAPRVTYCPYVTPVWCAVDDDQPVVAIRRCEHFTCSGRGIASDGGPGPRCPLGA